MDMLGIIIPIAIAHAIVLVALVLAIKRLLLSDTLRAVARINQVEEEVRKKEEAIRREIEEHEKDFARRRAEAEEALQRQKEQSEKEVAKLRDQITADARKEGDRLIDQARRQEEKIKQQFLQDLENKVVDYAGQVFRLVVSERMNDELNRAFIDELLDALADMDAGGITADAQGASFATSHPLKPEQRARIESLLKEKFEATVRVEEVIKPELLAGLVLKMGSLEIDGSLASRFNEAAGEVKKNIKL